MLLEFCVEIKLCHIVLPGVQGNGIVLVTFLFIAEDCLLSSLALRLMCVYICVFKNCQLF